MAEPKFSKGNRVRVIKLLDDFTSRELLGMELVIDDVEPLANGDYNYVACGYYMHEGELELISMKLNIMNKNVSIQPGHYEIINFDGYYWGHAEKFQYFDTPQTGVLMQYIDYPCNDYNVLLEVKEPDEDPRYVIITVPANNLTYLGDITQREK